MTARQENEILNCLYATPKGAGLRVVVQPRARRTGIVGVMGDRLKIGVKAAPEQGKANAELIRFLGKRFGDSAVEVRIVAGEHGRRKEIALAGITPEAAARRLFAKK